MSDNKVSPYGSNRPQAEGSAPSYQPPTNSNDAFYPSLNQNQSPYASQPSGYVAQSSNVNRNGYAQLPDSNEVSSQPAPYPFPSQQQSPQQQSPYAQPSGAYQQQYSSPYIAPAAQQPSFEHQVATCQFCNHTYPLPAGATSWRCKQCQKFNSLHGDQCRIL